MWETYGEHLPNRGGTGSWHQLKGFIHLVVSCRIAAYSRESTNMNKQLITVIADRQQPTTNTSIYKLYVSMPFVHSGGISCVFSAMKFWNSGHRLPALWQTSSSFNSSSNAFNSASSSWLTAGGWRRSLGKYGLSYCHHKAFMNLRNHLHVFFSGGETLKLKQKYAVPKNVLRTREMFKVCVHGFMS